eukprot:GDKJ01064831.1.p1 GENE.GDKJ01064831.1~~GDKJ01064831.1.p1  ORF type:complete len:568 (+),score=149.62 GDKJ01064831.1:207-1706(+)
MIMLIGQYSTGKTTFISHLLEAEYPGTRIGPEPTTDRFVAVMAGDRDQQLPGNAAVVDPNKPFERLSDFGNNFLSRFEVALSPSPLLHGFTVIDTPGVLAGNKQTSRGYDFEGVIHWFAERVDLILLMFDAHKLDISDEFKRCIHAIRGNDSKIRIVLNKADMISQQQLMRVYGALMWSLGKVIPTPETTRVYIGSFWDKPLDPKGISSRDLFEAEAADLFQDIQSLPRNASVRKLNDFVKRARLLRAHLHVCEYLRNEMPTFGKTSKQKKLMEEMPDIFQRIASARSLPIGDFPNPAEFNERTLENKIEFAKFPKLDVAKLKALDEVITKHIPALMKLLPSEEKRAEEEALEHMAIAQGASPFMNLKNGLSSANPEIVRFLSTPPNLDVWAPEWNSIPLDNRGFLTGDKAKIELSKSRLPSTILHRIWSLADSPSKDGCLSQYEYALSKMFIHMKVEMNSELPHELPAELYPADCAIPSDAPSALDVATQLALTAGRK